MAASAKTEYICPYCHDILCSRHTLLRHKQRKHPTEVKNENVQPIKPLICKDCDFRCLNIKTLIHHYQEHGRKLKICKNSFRNEEEFFAWKTETEVKTKSLFVLRRGQRETMTTFVRNFYCNRSGFFVTCGKGLRRLKASAKINYTCSAFLRVEKSKYKGTIKAEFCLDHTHECDEVSDGKHAKLARKKCMSLVNMPKTHTKKDLIVGDGNIVKVEMDDIKLETDAIKCEPPDSPVFSEGDSDMDKGCNFCLNATSSQKCRLHTPSVKHSPASDKHKFVQTTKLCPPRTKRKRTQPARFVDSNYSVQTAKKRNLPSALGTVRDMSKANSSNSFVAKSNKCLETDYVPVTEESSDDCSSPVRTIVDEVNVMRHPALERTKNNLLKMMDDIADVITDTSSMNTLKNISKHIVAAHALGKYLHSLDAYHNYKYANNSTPVPDDLEDWECMIEVLPGC